VELSGWESPAQNYRPGISAPAAFEQDAFGPESSTREFSVRVYDDGTAVLSIFLYQIATNHQKKIKNL